MEYLNHLSSSENKLSSISKGMKTQFFSNMSDIALNKHDELKFLILMREELFKYKFKTFCFNKWKVKTLYNRDLIDDENPFYNRKFNYDNFKRHNSISKEANNFNFNENRNAYKNYNANKFFDSLNSNNKNNSNRFFDSLNSHNYAYSGGGESDRFNQLGLNFIKNPNQQSNSIDKSNKLDKLLNNDELLRRNEDNENNLIKFNSNNNNDEDKKENNNDMMDYNYLLISNKKSIDSIQDSMNVLNVQKNINEALNNTNNLLTKLSSHKKEINKSDNKINEENENIFKDDDKLNNNEQKDNNLDKKIFFYDSLNYNDNAGDNYNLKKNKMNFKYIGKREDSNNKQYLNEENNKIIKELDYANEKGDNTSNSNVNEISNDENQIQNKFKSYSIKNIINKYKNLENINNENDIDNFIKNYNNDQDVQNDYQGSLEKSNNNNNNKLNKIDKNDDVGNGKYFEDINKLNENQKNINDNKKYKSEFMKNNLYYQNNIKNKSYIYNLIQNKIASINNINNNKKKKNNNYNINSNKDNIIKLVKNNINLENLKNKSIDNNMQNSTYEINQKNKINENRNIMKNNKLNNVKKNLFKKIDNKITSKKNDRTNNQRNLLHNNYKFNNKYNNKVNLDIKNSIKNFNNRTLLTKNNKNNLGKSYDYKTINTKKILTQNNSKNNSKPKKIFEKKIEMQDKSNKNKTIPSKYNNLLKISNNNKYKNRPNINKISNIKNNISNNKHNYRQNISENKLDLKKLYRFPIKHNEVENEKYNNKTAKYISVKYKNYLNSNLGDSSNKSLKNKYSFFIPKKNNLYDYLVNNSNQKNMEIALNTDKVVLNKLKKNRIKPKSKLVISNELFETNIVPNRAKTICNIKKNYSKINNRNSLNEAGDLLNHGFFSPINIKIKSKYNFGNNNNDDNENYYEESNYDLNNSKIKRLMKKYQQINYSNNLNKYDYIKKFKGDEANIFAINTVQNDNYYQTKNNDNICINEDDYNEIFQHNNNTNIDNINDTEYDGIFHKKNNLIKKNLYDILPNSQYNTFDEYTKSENNILANTRNVINYDNYYNYDDLVNNLSQLSKDIRSQYNSNTNKSNISKDKSRIMPDSTFDNFQSKSYMLSPIQRVPITNISFRARMRYFSNKKQKNLERMMKQKVEEDNQRYTFHPKTDSNKLNVIKYNNFGGNNLNTYKDMENTKKRKVDIRRINNLYMNYKDKEDKIDQLTRKYYKDAGISFSPTIIDRNKGIIKFKNKIGQIPYIDRMEVYDIKRKLKNDEKQIKYYNTIIQ